ncbi:hypothetical protein GCM10009799_04350 [Nocardiopsis rhodophaea]|uniref:RING-type E3 ubiquitin transferase n=1 Tax=Nocardiopsis rhodophaea TaxID=280238 RepID=A0ABN2S9B5_9ACTN
MDEVAPTLQLIALALVGFSAFLWLRAMRAHRHRRRLELTPDYTAGGLQACERLPSRAEINATAAEGPGGLLTSPYSQTPCVWFRVEVTHHHYREERGPGDRLEVERLFGLHSHEPFRLTDATGSVLCAPDWAEVDDAEVAVDQFVASEEPPADILSPAQLAAVGKDKCTSTTVIGPAGLTPGCTYKEWVIRPGQELFVGGLARRNEDGDMVIEGTEEDPVIISTHTEQEMINADWHKELLGFGLLPIALILLAALLILL